MARVNRTTGIFLVIGVIILIGTVAAPFYLQPTKDTAAPVQEQGRPDVYGRGQVDILTRVSTPVPSVAAGVISSVEVKEGDFVKAGAVLYKLDDTLAQAKVDEANHAVLAAQEQYLLAEMSVEERKSKIEGQKSAIAMAETAWKRVSEQYTAIKDRNEKIKGFDSEVKVAGLVAIQAHQLFELEQFKLHEMERLNPEKHMLALADLKRKEADLMLKTAKRVLDQHVVKAPRDGYILEVHLSVGDPFPTLPNAMQPRPIIVFQPNDPLIVRADIDQSNARFVKPGMKVTLTDHNPSNEQTWTGTVESLSRWVIRPRSILMEPDQINDAGSRECVIRIDGNPADFPIIGSTMSVRIHDPKKN
jgi:multidrug resistance efflux pump